MIFFAKGNDYMSGMTKILFWLSIAASIMLGYYICFNEHWRVVFDSNSWALLLAIASGIVTVTNVAGMVANIKGYRIGAFITIASVIIITVSAIFLYEVLYLEALNIIGGSVFCLWPTITTLLNQHNANVFLPLKTVRAGSKLPLVAIIILSALLIMVVVFGFAAIASK